jgi:ribonuclease HI
MNEVFIDGACSGNPGPGAWAVYSEDLHIEVSGGYSRMTSNAAELQALYEALLRIPQGKIVRIYTDSQWVFNAVLRGDQIKTPNLKVYVAKIRDKLFGEKGIAPIELVWKARNSTPGMQKADYMAKKRVRDIVAVRRNQND